MTYKKNDTQESVVKGTTEDGVQSSLKMLTVASRTPTAVRSWCSAWSQMPTNPVEASMARLRAQYLKAIRCLRGSWNGEAAWYPNQKGSCHVVAS